ncbi:MAG: translocation/assembly module TamB domain-containing protein, partial [Polaromonas sp.]|nr:translocation/assembly module TamB domain-containing protein [Polaromonas sp.]
LAQALRWLQKLPGLPASLQTVRAGGHADLQASWQGGWLDPALQARLAVPSLDWRSPGAKPGAAAADAAPAQPPAGLLKIRDLNATLSGRLSQAELGAQGRLEFDQRRVDLQLALDGGRLKPAGAGQTAFSASAWQGVLKQLSVRLEDPALGAGAWQLASRGAVALSWTPTAAGGAFESGAGQAILSAPRATTSSPAPAQATLAWQPVRWRPGELLTAGRITGLPMAWIELLGGAPLAGAGLGGNLMLDGQWDARLGDQLALKASLTRSSGDLTVQAETAQGTTARVAAGVRQAQLSLESVGDALTLALRWDSERAGSADGQLKTRLTRAPPGTGTGVGGWLWPADAPLNGQLRARLPRLGAWSVLAPPGWRLRGALAADIAISGSRAAPQLAGELQANDMALRSVVDGIEFGKGRLRATLDGTRMRISEFSLQGAGSKGTGGQLTAQGEAAWLDGKAQVQLTAKLERLRASIRTDREVTVSGDLQASLQGAQADLTGKLLVDQARILLP